MLKAKELKFTVWDTILAYLRSPQAARDVVDVFNYTEKEKKQLVEATSRIADQVQIIRNRYSESNADQVIPEAKIES